ncbi:MAG: hypothetical protein R3F02_06865 [Thiolinea sp.]
MLNKTADQDAIQRIINKGRKSGLGTAETQLSMNLKSSSEGAVKPVQKSSQKPLAKGEDETLSKPLAKGQSGLYGEWVAAVSEKQCRPSVNATWSWIQKRISNKETGSRTHDRTRITSMQKAFFSRAMHEGLMQQNPNYRNGGKKYIWIG